MIYVLGGRGRLGRAFAEARSAREVVVLDRSVYEDWWRPGSDRAISRFFAGVPAGSCVIVAAGLLDPALASSEHERVNLSLPLNVLDGACRAGLRVVTLGTVMERLVGRQNAYVASKTRLRKAVAERSLDGWPVVHAQIHTLYGGGPPSPHMFLGQMLAALAANQPFEMSRGMQLREYHHVDDEVLALHALLDAGVTGVVALNHGRPCSLRELASHVLESLDRLQLLRLGARPEPEDDNFATVLLRPPFLKAVEFRPALAGVARYMQEQLNVA